MVSMIGMIVYGSLLARKELRRLLPHCRQLHPVRLRGFQRSFSQEPAWRRRAGDERGVLNVLPHAGGSLNAVLLSGLSAEDLPALDHRERGYDRIPVDAAQLSLHDPAKSPQSLDSLDSLEERLEQVFVYRGKPERWNPRLRPHPSYLQLCLAGAGEWGEAFLREFLETTFVGSEPLVSRDDAAGGILRLPRG